MNAGSSSRPITCCSYFKASELRRSCLRRMRGTNWSQRLFAEDGHPPHQPPLIGAEVGACMQRAAIVPDHEIADSPDVLVNEFAALLVVEQHGKQVVALLG